MGTAGATGIASRRCLPQPALRGMAPNRPEFPFYAHLYLGCFVMGGSALDGESSALTYAAAGVPGPYAASGHCGLSADDALGACP